MHCALFFLGIIVAVHAFQSDGRFFIYDWPGVSPNWIGDSVFQWNLETHGYGDTRNYILYHRHCIYAFVFVLQGRRLMKREDCHKPASTLCTKYFTTAR